MKISSYVWYKKLIRFSYNLYYLLSTWKQLHLNIIQMSITDVISYFTWNANHLKLKSPRRQTGTNRLFSIYISIISPSLECWLPNPFMYLSSHRIFFFSLPFLLSFSLFYFHRSEFHVSVSRQVTRLEASPSEASSRIRSVLDLGAPSLGAVFDDLFIPM